MTTPSSVPAESGLIVVDKPPGWTSHQVVGRVRRLLGTRKVGHAGTLDPMATGVLVVGVNRATRLLGYLSLTDKAYAATIRLGVTTVTDDAEGEIVTATGATDLTDARLTTAVSALTGPIQQIPSAVSAIKVDGVRSYARVRAGQDVTLQARRSWSAGSRCSRAARGRRPACRCSTWTFWWNARPAPTSAHWLGTLAPRSAWAGT